MALIYHLVKIKQNTHGQLQPINHEHCPLYKDKEIMGVCQDGDNFCIGIEDKNVIKQIGEMKYIIQCNYCNLK